MKSGAVRARLRAMIAPDLLRLGSLSAGLLVAALLIPSCSESNSAPYSTSAGSVQKASQQQGGVRLPEITPATGFPAKVKNFDGHTVLLESPPSRLIAGNASLLDALIPLVEPGRMAALPSTAFSYSSLAVDPGVWKEVPVLRRFDAEEILGPSPDLVLIQAYQAGSAIDRIIERDVPVVVFPVASSWKSILGQIRCLSRLMDVAARGEEVIGGLEERRQGLQTRARRSGMRVLPYGNYGSGGTTAGSGTTWQVMIELAGMRNAAAEAGLDAHPEIDFEQLLSIDPDFFLIARSEGQSGSGSLEILMAEPLLADLQAIRERRFLVLPEYLYSAASQQLLTAAESMASQADALLSTD
jgi:iron complex transport system substrate-binding protein